MASPVPIGQNLALLYQAYHTQASAAGLQPLHPLLPAQTLAAESLFSGSRCGGDGADGPREGRSMDSNTTTVTPRLTPAPSSTPAPSFTTSAPSFTARLAATAPARGGPTKSCWEGELEMATSLLPSLPPSLTSSLLHSLPPSLGGSSFSSLDHSQPFAAKSAHLLLASRLKPNYSAQDTPLASMDTSSVQTLATGPGPQSQGGHAHAHRLARTPLSSALDLAAACPATFSRLLESGALDSALLEGSLLDTASLDTALLDSPHLKTAATGAFGCSMPTLDASPHSVSPLPIDSSLALPLSPGLSTSSLGPVPALFQPLYHASTPAPGSAVKADAEDGELAGASSATLLRMLQRLTEEGLTKGAPNAALARAGLGSSVSKSAAPAAAGPPPSFPSHGASSYPQRVLSSGGARLGTAPSLGSGSLRSSVSSLPPLPLKTHFASSLLGDAALSDGGEDGGDDADLDPKAKEARRLRRLASNRESAKRSRRRKLERLQELEVLVEQLQAEHREAQGRLAAAEAQLQHSEHRNQELEARLAGLRSPAVPPSNDAPGHGMPEPDGGSPHGQASASGDVAPASDDAQEEGQRAAKRARVEEASGCDARGETPWSGEQLRGGPSEAGARAVEALTELSEFFSDELAYDF